MSLLPQQIPPETIPIGKLEANGSVRMEHNWWLFLYNLFLNVLGGDTSGGLPADALQDLESADLDAVDADAIALRLPVANLGISSATSADLESLGAQVAQLSSEVAALKALVFQDADFSASPAPPTAKVALAAVDGHAQTFMRSDAAPPLDVTIAPTWTGAHTFKPAAGVALTVQAAADTSALAITSGYGGSSTGADATISRAGSTANNIGEGPNLELIDSTAGSYTHIQQSGGQTEIWAYYAGNYGWTQVAFLDVSFGLNVKGGIGFYGNRPPAQVTGWGTPTGSGVVANFSGASATLAQCSEALAKIITDLKSLGLYGA